MLRSRRWGGILSLHPESQPDATYVLHRENILVLDIFFEALNYETIEQKKAYEVAGLLGECWWLCQGALRWHPASILQNGWSPGGSGVSPRHRGVLRAWMQSHPTAMARHQSQR